MAAYRYRRVNGLKSPAGWLPVHRDQLRVQLSETSMGELYLYHFVITYYQCCAQKSGTQQSTKSALKGGYVWKKRNCLINEINRGFHGRQQMKGASDFTENAENVTQSRESGRPLSLIHISEPTRPY